MNFSKAPVVSFSKSKKIEKPNDNPGVGLYNPKDKYTRSKVPEYNFPKSKKMNHKPLETPGVGEYNVDVKHSKSPQYSIPKKTREITINEKLNYSVSNNGSVPFNSKSPVSSKTKDKPDMKNEPQEYNNERGSENKNSTLEIVNNTPGPGAYCVKEKFIKCKTQSYSFGKAKRTKDIDTTPGPGEYLNDGSTKNKGFKLGNTKRDFKIYHTENTPGPGNYNSKPKTAKPPSYTIGKKYDNSNKLISPGPGEYLFEQKDLKTKAPVVKIGTSSRDDLIVDKNKVQVPGPGLYNINKSKEKGFNKEKRMKDPKEITPGPGEYMIPSSISDVQEKTSTVKGA